MEKNNYKHVVGEQDYRKAAHALKAANYATDPEYANKLISIIENYGLEKYDKVPVLVAEYHMQKHGWLSKTGTDLTLGEAGQNLRLEDLRLAIPQNDKISINFSAHIENVGWVNNVSEGYSAGNEGKSRRMEAVRMNLTGEAANGFDIYYRVYSDTLGWSGWAKNGEEAGTEGYRKKIQSIQIKISWKNEVPVDTSGISYRKFLSPHVYYQSHAEYHGWLPRVRNGALSGTTGKGRRLEAIQIYMSSLPYDGGIDYQTHVQSYGWLPKVANGMTSGTTGERKRIEAIKINLTSTMAEEFDVYYRTHIESYGWTGWSKNGEPSGSEGLAKRMEATEIKLVRKGDKAPTSSVTKFYMK